MKIQNPLKNVGSLVAPKSWVAGATLLMGAGGAAARDLMASAPASAPAPGPEAFAPGPGGLISALIPAPCLALANAAAGCVLEAAQNPWYNDADLFAQYGVGGFGGVGQALCNINNPMYNPQPIAAGPAVLNYGQGPSTSANMVIYFGCGVAVMVAAMAAAATGVRMARRARRSLASGAGLELSPMQRPRVPAEMYETEIPGAFNITLGVTEDNKTVVVTHPL